MVTKMKITCECGEELVIYRSRDPTLIVDWIDWICTHLFSHSAIYCKDAESFELTFKPTDPGPVRVFDGETGEEITEMFEDEEND